MSRIKILRASAGSGKTYRLSFEYIKAVIENPGVYGSILAVTFTNKATGEMKRRILEQLHALSLDESPYMADLVRDTSLSKAQIVANAGRALGLILSDYSRFSVSTIDKFFQRIVRSFLKELDLDFNYTIELERDGMLAQAVDRVVERSSGDPFLRGYLSQITMQRVEQGGQWDVREPLMEIGKELFQEHYQQQEVPLEQIMEQFTAIKNDVQQRIELLREVCARALELIARAGLEPSDFKQGRNSFAQYFAKVYRGGGLIDKYSSYFSKAAADPAQCYTDKSPRKSDIMAILPQLSPLIQQVEAMYDALEPDMVSVDMISKMFDHYLLLRYVSQELSVVWSEQGRIPIHQTNKLITKLVESCHVPFIYEKVGNRYDRYMIDEFQDTSLGQWRNFEPLLLEAVSQTLSESVMLIGDVKQAIYRWRGGDWSLLSSVAGRCFETGDVDDSELLSTNWRSERQVVEFNNMLVGGVVALDRDIMCEHLGAQYGNSIDLAYGDFEQSVPPSKGEQGYVSVRSYGKDDTVEQLLITTISDALERGYGLGEIAILVRKKEQGRQVAQMLLKAGYSVVSNEALRLCESEIVSFVCSALALSVDRKDRISLAIFNRLLGRELACHLPEGEKELFRRMAHSSPIEALELVVSWFSLQDEPQLNGQVAYLQAFYQVMQDYCGANVPDMAAFLRWWDGASDKISIPMPESGDAISIMTIHKSKGLEFACVVIPFADWSLLPSTGAMTKTVLWVKGSASPFDQLPPLPVAYGSDMRRSYFLEDYLLESMYSHIDAVNMLYVGVTRAREELYIMYQTPSQPKQGDAPSRISNLIAEVVGGSDFETGTKHQNRPTKESTQEGLVIEDFPSHYAGASIRTNWSSERYFEQRQALNGESTPLPERQNGVLLHSVLERITTLDQAAQLLEKMRNQGLLSSAQLQSLEKTIAQIQLNDTIKDWFSNKWQVLNEQTILAPHAQTYRPDRVIAQGHRATVIDYKFGNLKTKTHHTQVLNYMALLKDMGYTHIEGFLWYIELEEIQAVI